MGSDEMHVFSVNLKDGLLLGDIQVSSVIECDIIRTSGLANIGKSNNTHYRRLVKIKLKGVRALMDKDESSGLPGSPDEEMGPEAFPIED